MIVLGVDPGIERLGWGIIEKTSKGLRRIDSGVKITSKSDATSQRLFAIYNFLDELIAIQKPTLLGIERVFFTTNAKTAITIGEVRGVVLTLAAKYDLSVAEFSPPEIKVAVSGNGTADKKEIASMLRFSMELPSRKMLDDETDALAIALTTAVNKKNL